MRKPRIEATLFDMLIGYFALQEEQRNRVEAEYLAVRQNCVHVFLEDIFSAIQELAIEPAAFNREVSALIDAEFTKVSLRFSDAEKEVYFSQLNLFRRFFADLYYHIENEQEKEAHKKGSMYQVKQLLNSQYDPEFYSDAGGALEDIRLSIEPIQDIMLVHLSEFCNLAVDNISRRFSPGELNVFIRPASLDRSASSGLVSFTHEASKGKLNKMCADSDTSLQREGTQEFLENAVPQKIKFKDKWRLLSAKKKLYMAGFLFLGIASVIAAGFFVPGSELFTIPALGVVTAKILSVLLGSALVLAVACAMPRVLRKNEGKKIPEADCASSVSESLSNMALTEEGEKHRDQMEGESFRNLAFFDRVRSSSSSPEEDDAEFLSYCDEEAVRQGASPAAGYVE